MRTGLGRDAAVTCAWKHTQFASKSVLFFHSDDCLCTLTVVVVVGRDALLFALLSFLSSLHPTPAFARPTLTLPAPSRPAHPGRLRAPLPPRHYRDAVAPALLRAHVAAVRLNVAHRDHDLLCGKCGDISPQTCRVGELALPTRAIQLSGEVLSTGEAASAELREAEAVHQARSSRCLFKAAPTTPCVCREQQLETGLSNKRLKRTLEFYSTAAVRPSQGCSIPRCRTRRRLCGREPPGPDPHTTDECKKTVENRIEKSTFRPCK